MVILLCDIHHESEVGVDDEISESLSVRKHLSDDAVLKGIIPCVVDVLEKDGEGLNLTYEVLDGILHHTKGEWAHTPEGKIVRLADRIAYINHDIDDAKREGLITEDELPEQCKSLLGTDSRMRINTMVRDIIERSRDKQIISMSEDVYKAIDLDECVSKRTVKGGPSPECVMAEVKAMREKFKK